MTTIFALFALLTLAGLVVFQVALILGAPIGRFAWGGQHHRLPTQLRIASVISILLYILFMVFIASKAGLIDTIGSNAVLTAGMWVFTSYFFLGIVMNGISKSKPERVVMTPVATILAVSFLIVSLN